MANGKIIYPSGATSQITYNFPKNCDYGHKSGARLGTNDDARTLDGTFYRYTGAKKKKYELTFSYVNKAQKDYFLDLWDFQCPIDLYLDGVNFDATVLMKECPDPQSEPYFDEYGEPTYSFDVMFEEV